MKNILVITLGNSEIQINKSEINDFDFRSENHKYSISMNGINTINLNPNRFSNNMFMLKSSRNDGKIVFEQYEDFKNIIKFPLTEPLINYLHKNNFIFREVWLVYTDQADENFRNTDTIYFAYILENYLKSKYSNLSIVKYPIIEGLKDIDKQYKDFESFTKNLNLESEIDEIYLFPQGGIDQINQALTLQFIQRFKNKVFLFQKAENSEPVQLKFPNLFLNDLTKQQIKKHLEDYDFEKAGLLIFANDKLKNFCSYLADRLSLKHDLLDQSNIDEQFQFSWNKSEKYKRNEIKLHDLTYAFKIDLLQRKYNDALTKLYTIYENLFKQKIDNVAKMDTSEFFDKKFERSDEKNKKWEEFLTAETIKRLIKKKSDLKINNPNSMTYYYLFRFQIEDQKIDSFSEQECKLIDGILNDLRHKRNEVNHSLGSVTNSEIEEILARGKRKLNIESFLKLVDKFIGTDGLYIYETAQKKMLQEFE